MHSSSRQGRILGLLLFVQLAGLIVPFVMLRALYAPPGFLESAAHSATQVRWSLLLLLANGALTVAISLFAHPALRPSGRVLADALIVLGAAWFILQAVDNTHVRAMLALSQRSLESPGASRETLEALGALAASTRRTAHYTVLLMVGTWMLAFYSAIWRARLVPSAVAALGVLAAALHVAGVSLPVLLGYPGQLMVAPGLAVSHGVLIVWLLAKGFAAPHAPR